MVSTKRLDLSEIRTDGGTQTRSKLSQGVVRQYAELMRDKERKTQFPAVRVVYDGESYWLADGFHRLAAAKEAKLKGVVCEISAGTKRDAILIGAEANRSHGSRMSPSDLRSLAAILLSDPEWSQWSNRKLADLCGASEGFIRKIRKFSLRTVRSEKSTEPENSAEKPATDVAVKYTTKHGTTAKMKVSKPPRERLKTVEVDGVRLAAHLPLETHDQGGAANDSSQAAGGEPKRKDATAANGILDGNGNPVAEDLREVFAIRKDCELLLREVSGVMKTLRELSSRKGGEKLESILNQSKVDCENLRRAIRFATPHEACPYCRQSKGAASVSCKACRGLGWVCEGIAQNAPAGVA